MIESRDEQLTMHIGISVIPTGINGQEKGEEDASKDADEIQRTKGLKSSKQYVLRRSRLNLSRR
jgi:hypothetical protein